MKIKQGMSEKQWGYLLVLPAIVVILVIAIWPVLRSFWLSLYDVQLNNPTKNAVYHDYGINVEKFAEVYPIFISNIKNAEKVAESSEKSEWDELRSQVENLKSRLDQNPKFAKQYEQVDELLFNGEPVPEDLSFVTLDQATAEQVKKQMASLHSQAKEVAKSSELQNKNILGLSNSLQGTLISPNFIGLGHYIDLLQQNRLWDSLGNTVVFTIISVFFELVFGLAIALLINRQFKGRGLVRASVLIPWAIPTVISALMWKFMFDGQNGIISKLFEMIGIVPNMSVLLTTKVGSMFAVIFADIWKTTPFMALLLLAGLQTIPSNLYEAAEVDGASKTQQFFRITLPLLKSTILVALLFRTLDAFRVFDLVYVLTGGGPANATETISIFAYKTMFAQMNFGAGSALSVIVFVSVAFISVIFVKLLGTDLIHDGRSK